MAEPALTTVEIVVCDLCLSGVSGECHSPGCVFWMCPAPSAEQAEKLLACAVDTIE